MTEQVDIHELRKTATERRKQLDDIAADALTAAADEIERLRSRSPRVIDTTAELDALPTGAVLRGLGNYGGVWEVTDAEDLKRYSSAADNSYSTGSIFLEHCGPFELLWSPETP